MEALKKGDYRFLSKSSEKEKLSASTHETTMMAVITFMLQHFNCIAYRVVDHALIIVSKPSCIKYHDV